MPAVQQQTGKVDCGIFAIAFAYHAASGDDPAELQFQQERMRDHLLQCFKKKKLTSFPHTILAKQRKQDAFPYHEIEVFCDCIMPEVYDDMVQCEECEDWFHMHCVGLKSPPPESETWQCSKCTSS